MNTSGARFAESFPSREEAAGCGNMLNPTGLFWGSEFNAVLSLLGVQN